MRPITCDRLKREIKNPEVGKEGGGFIPLKIKNCFDEGINYCRMGSSSVFFKWEEKSKRVYNLKGKGTGERKKKKKRHKDGNVNFGYFFSGFSRSKLQLLHF